MMPTNFFEAFQRIHSSTLRMKQMQKQQKESTVRRFRPADRQSFIEDKEVKYSKEELSSDVCVPLAFAFNKTTENLWRAHWIPLQG
jgi:hypothetical protein